MDVTVTPVLTSPPQSISSELLTELLSLLSNIGLTQDAAESVLGDHGISAVISRDPATLHWISSHIVEQFKEESTSADRPLTLAVLQYYAHIPLSQYLLTELYGNDLLNRLIDAEILQSVPGGLVPALSINSIVRGEDSFLLASDLDASLESRVSHSDHVLGAGPASFSLLNMIPSTPAETVLDLGTGSGVLALAEAHKGSQRIVATDVHPRAHDFAQANFDHVKNSAPGSNLELRLGSWFEPVSGELFDRIISNPPFVVGDGTVEHVYKDSTFILDGATEHVFTGSIQHLKPGGHAHLLAAWVETTEQSGDARLASWLPEHGVHAWVLRREQIDPSTYIRTWLEDENLSPQSAEGMQKTLNLLNFFQEHNVSSINLGFIHVHKTEDPTDNSHITIEDISGPALGFFGDEVIAHTDAMNWLESSTPESIMDARFRLHPQVFVEEISQPDLDIQQGIIPTLTRISRGDLYAFSHEIDDIVLSILKGLHPQGLSIGEVIELYAMVNDYDSADIQEKMLLIVSALVQHRIILPQDLP